MSDFEEHKLFSVVPPQESKCVWMTAGILSYQLCEREFDCEECPLDIALRQRFVHDKAVVGRGRAMMTGKVPEEPRGVILYGRKHLWLSRKGEKKVRLGIEPGMASVIVSPKAIVLPAFGARIVRNKACSWIVLEGGTLPMFSPISGQVVATNNLLAENPHAVCVSPLDEGWLFELSVNDADVDDADVLPTADVAQIYSEDERPLKALLSAEMTKGESENAKVDHGQLVQRLSETLSPTEYLNLLRSTYT
jgi:glycine cleavage system H protein